MLVAVYLIVVQLMLVIAIALFFSTFSSPMLSAVFAFGLYIAGHFSADCKNFDVAVGDSPVRVRDHRLSTICCRTWRCST